MYKAQILCDSVNTSGNRLTTFELTLPRCVWDEFLTHRVLSRNAASSRAIPAEKMIKAVESGGFVPVFWGVNRPGMQAYDELQGVELKQAIDEWLDAMRDAIRHARRLNELGAHKQIVNRVIQSFSWITAIVSGTEWENFFGLRQDDNMPYVFSNEPKSTVYGDNLKYRFNPKFPAQPEIQVIAHMAHQLYYTNSPTLLEDSEWHLPLINENDRNDYESDNLVKISVGRCARVSYLTHDGKRDPLADIALCERLSKDNHWSPLEHVAQSSPGVVSGNFEGWTQYRKYFPNESGRKVK